MRRSVLLTVMVACLSGCYTFQPASVTELAPGVDVRARITGTFADSLAAILPGDSRILEGTFIEVTGSRVYIDVPTSSAYQGMRLQTLNQRIEIPSDEFVDLERKQLSRGRTGLALGAVATAAAALIISQLTGEAGGGTSPGTGGPVDAVVATPSVSLIVALSRLWQW
ncbi:MAG: hypothetical protein ACPHO4_05850 [Longimicrobiales bacterium]